MATFPRPPDPAVLARVPAEEHTLPAATICWRIYFQGGPHPTAWNAMRGWGPTGARFDHHLPPAREQERRVLYAATEAETCFAEVYQETRTIDRRRHAPWLVGFALARPVRLLDLTGTWPTRAGASMAINSGSRARARLWSQAIWAACPAIDGLHYCSSMNANRPAIAFYERAVDALPARPLFHRALTDPVLGTALVRVAERFNYVVV